GQHYDYGMSRIFFDEMGLAAPDVNLGVGSGTHGRQTARMLEGLEEVMLAERPERVLVYGDTNSTLAGALAAVKLGLRLAHVEAGLRSFNREMPEEVNRVLADHCSDLLFCPTETAVRNLAREGIRSGVHLAGDTMLDATLQFAEVARLRSRILEELSLRPKAFLLATLHRPYNTDDPEKMRELFRALADAGETVVFPVHPRTRARLEEFGVTRGAQSATESGAKPATQSGTESGAQSVTQSRADAGTLRMIDPVGYLDMLALEQNARLILTDSGGVQKEAYFFGVPCVTLRPETEWVETVEAGWNVVAGANRVQILDAVRGRAWPEGPPPSVFGDGQAARRIVARLAEPPSGR
ncbi:MAG TPA: UDP-N-acetyl glucosamine 2-epimerase, partial [Pyrinomonadaceae bacterium]|nr:UDP-N-acetyl glucosamine 2-epimerase [Pyrinomonadaceae bacterium]